MVAARTRFLGDLAIGRQGEARLLELCRRHGLDCGLNPSRTKAGRTQHDVYVDLPGHGQILIEVKFDRWESRSGNVAVEYFNPRSQIPSGITATVASIWVFVLGDRSTWACRTSDLLRQHNKNEEATGFVRDLPVCGDRNSSSRLYDRTQLFGHIFFRLDTLRSDEFIAVLEVLAS